MYQNILKLIRPHQYIKNLFIFAPLFFVGQIANVELFLNLVVTFIAFSISASAIYILNDFQDIEEDRQHPEKKYRPLASGAISKKTAIVLMNTFFIVGISLMATLSLQALVILCLYIALNFGYSFYFKRIAILDVTIISIGFVLRLFVGSAVIEIPLSMWIVIMTFLLSLFLALAKRRDDVLLFINTGKKMRKAIGGYNLQFIDGAMMIMASVVIVSYILYTTSIDVFQSAQSEYLYLTALFVILGIMRYLQIAFIESDSGSPTKIIFNDKFIQVTILAWILSFVWIIYL
ncbi:decaprenyl-phosphate phosphoribosyltransferase [Candidatus Woesearchaeota archaeon]|jgi:decaprenyl-phosphate phosphoribosyltransferase|nr:decaprenyl-phosphate phosphoribosyltransferase [Candidatus Woesearchaeota archaeon]